MDVDIICLWKNLENLECSDGVMYSRMIKKLPMLMTEMK